MLQVKKMLVILLVASLLAPIFISLTDEEPEITVVVNRIEIDTDYGKPPGTPGGKPDKPDKTDGGKPGDYKLMGVKWYVEDLPLTLYVGDEGMTYAITQSAAEWDKYTSASLVNEVVYNTEASYIEEIQTNIPDYKNELVYDDLDSTTIAVCYTWYIGDKIIQFDIAFNTDYTWGDADPDGDEVGDPILMDLQNIATHELGHGFGLADIYKRKLSHLTMYGYSDYGDVAKRTLEQGDIEGIQALYGVPP